MTSATSSFLSPLFKILLALGLLVLTAIAVIIIIFNGNNVKSPFLKLIAAHTSLNVDFKEIEFSPLYPNVFKIKDLKIGELTVAELYCEYELTSLVAKEHLVISDLYAKGLNLDEKKAAMLTADNFGFKNIEVKNLSLVDASLENQDFALQNCQANFKNLSLKGSQLSIEKAEISAPQGRFLDLPFNNATLITAITPERFDFEHVALKLLGGTLQGQGYFERKDAHLHFDNFRAQKLILKNKLNHLSISADTGKLEDLSVPLDQDLYLGELSGDIAELKLNDKSFEGIYKGHIGEISYLALNLSLDANEVEANFQHNISFKAKGGYLDGHYALSGNFDKDKNNLVINNLDLDGVLFEPQDELFEKAKTWLKNFSYNIQNLNLNNIALISHLHKLPLSVKKIDGSIADLSFDKNGLLETNKTLMLDLKVLDATYSDLYIHKLSVLANLSAEIFNLTIPDLTLRKSQAHGALAYNRHTHSFYLLATTQDFELSSLNSSLIPHILGGKVDVDIDLKGTYNQGEFLQGLQGHLKAQGDNLLVSNLGLDLLNGGDKRDYSLSAAQLESALRDDDSMLVAPKLKLDFNGKKGFLNFNCETIVNKIKALATLDLETQELKGQAKLISIAEDSQSILSVEGKLLEPQFNLKALERGEKRPGITPNLNR